MLGTQVNIQDRLTKASKYTDAKAAKTALEKKSQQKNYDANLLTENGNQYVDDIDEAADMISYLNKLKEDYQSNLEEYEKYHYDPNKKNDIAMWGKNQTKKREVALKQSEQDLNTFQGELSEKVSKISEDSQRMLDENGDPVDSSFNDVLGRVDNLLTSYYNATNSSSYFEEKLNNIFAKHDFKNIKDDLLKKGKSGGSDAIKDSIKDNQDFVDTLTKYGISIDDLAKEIMSEINPDAIDYDGIRQNLKDTFSYKNGLYDFFKDKPNEDVKGFWDYIQANNYNPKEYDWGKAEVSDIYDDYQKSKEDVEIPSSTFSSLFKNSAEDTSTDLDTITDNFQTDMSNIKSAMDSIKSGTFQNSDITDLIQQFPELATETDNLQQGLQKLTFDKASTAIGKIRDSVKDVTDPKELAAADKYIQSIMDTMDLSDFDVSNSKHTKDTIISNLKGDSIGPIKSASLINQLFSEYGDDKVAMQAIMKLSLDPSMANADLDTWKSKIEDTKVQIQLDTSAKNLDNLSKELTRLQTDASDQQTRLNNKSAYNMKATASDYTNLIENGDKQIENLNNQIKEYQNNIDALKNSKGLSPLSDEDNEQIKQWQDQIQASQMSIENMKLLRPIGQKQHLIFQ